jgi:hypothetical protein
VDMASSLAGVGHFEPLELRRVERTNGDSHRKGTRFVVRIGLGAAAPCNKVVGPAAQRCTNSWTKLETRQLALDSGLDNDIHGDPRLGDWGLVTQQQQQDLAVVLLECVVHPTTAFCSSFHH